MGGEKNEGKERFLRELKVVLFSPEN